MEIGIIISLLLLSAILFLIEMFLIPGISIAGIAGGIAGIIAVVYAFTLGTAMGWYTLLSGVLLTALLVWIFFKSNALDKMALKTGIDSKHDPLKDLDIKVGDEGVAVSRIAPMGKIKVNGCLLEAKANDDFIDEGTAVVITVLNTTNVIVDRK